jgi:hypothetical protein
VQLILATSESINLEEGSQDFGYSLGVLHHIPDTSGALRDCVGLLKSGAPFLVYLYYDFENRTILFRMMWRLSDLLRRAVCKLPGRIRDLCTDVIAATIYFPLARTAGLLHFLGVNEEGLPLAYYRTRSFYTMRTDARDRFGTPLEKRFSKAAIAAMMSEAGLEGIEFSNAPPYWCAVGRKRR